MHSSKLFMSFQLKIQCKIVSHDQLNLKGILKCSILPNSHFDKNQIVSNSSEEPQMTSRSSYSSRALKLPEKTSILENVFLKTADGTFKCLWRAKISGFSCAVQHHAVRVNPHNPHKHSLKTTDWKKSTSSLGRLFEAPDICFELKSQGQYKTVTRCKSPRQTHTFPLEWFNWPGNGCAYEPLNVENVSSRSLKIQSIPQNPVLSS